MKETRPQVDVKVNLSRGNLHKKLTLAEQQEPSAPFLFTCVLSGVDRQRQSGRAGGGEGERSVSKQ